MYLLRKTIHIRLLRNTRRISKCYKPDLSDHIKTMDRHKVCVKKHKVYVKKHGENIKLHEVDIIEHKTNINMKSFLSMSTMIAYCIKRDLIRSYNELCASHSEYVGSQKVFDKQCIEFDDACYHYDMRSDLIYEVEVFRKDALCFHDDCKVFEQESKEFYDEAYTYVHHITK
jgi:hypothetical protein